MCHNASWNVTEATEISKSRYYETLCKKKSRYDILKNAQNSVEKRNRQNHSILQKIKNKKNKKFSEESWPTLRVPKAGGVGCNLPYIPINHWKSAFYLRQKRTFSGKNGKNLDFSFLFLFESEISIHNEKRENEK